MIRATSGDCRNPDTTGIGQIYARCCEHQHASFGNRKWLNYPPELATLSPDLFTTYLDQQVTTLEKWLYKSSSVCGAFTYPEQFDSKSEFTTTLITTVYEPNKERDGWRSDPCSLQLDDCRPLERDMSSHLPHMWSNGPPLGITTVQWPWCQTTLDQSKTGECSSSAGPATVYYWRNAKSRDMCASEPTSMPALPQKGI